MPREAEHAALMAPVKNQERLLIAGRSKVNQIGIAQIGPRGCWFQSGSGSRIVFAPRAEKVPECFAGMAADRLKLAIRQLTRAPTPSQGLDQQNARIHAPPQNIRFRALVAERNVLGGDHFKVGHQAAFVTIQRKLE